MKKPLYTSPDIEVNTAYLNFLKEYQNIEARETTYADELAIVDAYLNRFLNPDESNPISPDTWRLIIDTLKFKVLVIKEQRLEYDRLEKRKQLKSLPIEDVNQIVQEMFTAILPYVPEDYQAVAIAKLNLVLTTANSKV